MRGRWLDAVGAALVVGQLAASALLVPMGDRIALPGGGELGGLCWFRAVFQVPCPLCGMTRSFAALAHGDIGAALYFHPAGPLLFAAMAVFALAALAALVRRTRPVVQRPGFMYGVEAVAVVCAAVGALRMMRS